VSCSAQTNFTPFDAKWVPMSAKFAVVGCYPKGSGALQVHELDGASLKLVAQREVPEGVKCATFGATSYEARQLATGDYAGQLAVWDLERLGGGGDSASSSSVGTGAGAAPSKAAPVFQVKGHTSIINAIDGIGGLNVGSGAPEIVTGSRDGQ